MRGRRMGAPGGSADGQGGEAPTDEDLGASEVGDGGEQADVAVGRLADGDVERGRLGAEDAAVLGPVDGGDVDAVLDRRARWIGP